ncbi:MAG: AMP-binding protein [Planctomycetes bacterium]|nr:AMP-binding protein [Planctomycetota bacterium]
MGWDREAWARDAARRMGVPEEAIRKAFREELAGPRSADAPLEVPDRIEMEYRYSYGGQSRFFREVLEHRRLLGSRCTTCGKVYLPPRTACGDCYAATEWVPLGDRGTVRTFTTVHYATSDFFRRVPFVCAYVQVDGADTLYLANVVMDDPRAARVGMRVRAVFLDDPRGDAGDFWFEPVAGDEEGARTAVGTLRDLVHERARERGEGTFLIFEDREETYAELAAAAARAGAALTAAGVAPGDRVALLVSNRPEFIHAFFGCFEAGAIAVPINALLKPPEVAYIVEHSGACSVVTERALAGLVPPGPSVLDVDAGALAGAGDRPPPSRCPPLAPGDTAALVYTSGTTGRPKGAMLSHASYLVDAQMIARHASMTPEDRFLGFLPLFHVNAQVVTTLAPMVAGGTLVLMRQFSPRPFLETLARHRCTAFSAVPTVYAILLNTPGLEGHAPWDLSSLRFCICGAAPMPVEVFRGFEARFHATIMEGYGLTEGTCASSVNPPSGLRKVGSIGLPLEGQRMRIADDSGREVPEGEVGEILVAGPNVMQGYWNNAEATRQVIQADGWLNTGDTARIDPRGHVFITGRLKEIIVLSNGEKVPPVDMEAAIARDPLFEQVMLLGEARPYLSVMAVLSAEHWKKLCGDHRLEAGAAGILQSKQVADIVLQRVAVQIGHFPGYAQVRRVALTLEPWSVENGMLTPTLKLKRAKVIEKFHAEVDQMYSGH